MFCKFKTVANRRYQRDVRWLLVAYFVALGCSAWFVKHGAGHGVARYLWSVLPTLPIIAIIVRMAQYLHEETDEYLRLLQMNRILAGTGALLTALLISDFLRAFGNAPDFAPFVLFFCFAAGMAVMQFVQWLRNRVPADE